MQKYCKLLLKATNREVRVPLIEVQDGRLTKEDTDFGHRCHPLSFFQIRRHRLKALPAIENWHEIPEVYRVTKRDDFGATEDQGEVWLRQIPEEHEMVVEEVSW